MAAAVKQELDIHKDLHKYIVGPKGATIQKLESDNGTFFLNQTKNLNRSEKNGWGESGKCGNGIVRKKMDLLKSWKVSWE